MDARTIKRQQAPGTPPELLDNHRITHKARGGVKMRSVHKLRFDLMTDELYEVEFFKEFGHKPDAMRASDPELQTLDLGVGVL